MKLITICSVLFFFSSVLQAETDTALRRSNRLLRFIAENSVTRNFALGTLINNRCDRYMTYFDAQDCRLAVKKMIQILDFDIILAPDKAAFNSASFRRVNNWGPSSFVFVAFKNDFINLLSQKATSDYLSDLNQQLYQFMVGEIKTLNVFELTKKYYKTEYAAARAMAALFQDTSSMKLHLGYLHVSQARGNSFFQKNQELLHRVIDTINMVLNRNENHFRALFYPQEILPYVNQNIYHFYVPLYLSKALHLNGHDKRDSLTAAFMLTLTYEFVTAAPDYSNLYSDPRILDKNKPLDAYKMRDIFGGYSGANYGVNGRSFRKDFALFQELFARSTREAVELMLGY